ncbi:MAG: transposase [Terriglobia bacterium]
MRRRDKSGDRGWLFITGATYRRLPLFQVREYCGIFLENLRFYRKKYGFDVAGYVLLPDHYHLLLAMPTEVALPVMLRDFKSAVGKQVVEALKKNGQEQLLRGLSLPGVPRRRKDARFRVLQADNYIKRVFTEKFLQQKLDYIHTNPVREGLVQKPLEYPYSSARWYAGKEGERAQWQGPLG